MLFLDINYAQRTSHTIVVPIPHRCFPLFLVKGHPSNDEGAIAIDGDAEEFSGECIVRQCGAEVCVCASAYADASHADK